MAPFSRIRTVEVNYHEGLSTFLPIPPVMSSDNGDDGEPGDEPASDSGGAGGHSQGGGGQPQGDQSGGGQPRDAAGQPRDGGPQGGQPPQGQRGGQQQQGPPPQGQAAGGQGPPGPPQGQPPVRQRPSAGQRLQAAFGDYAVQNQIKAVVGLWALVGLGVGLLPVLMGLASPLGLVLGAGVLVALAIGPVVAGLVGLSLSSRLPVGTLESGVVSGVVNYVGYLVMVLLAGILASVSVGGGGTGGVGGGGFGGIGAPGIGQLIAPVLIGGLAVGIVAGLATALGQYVDYPATSEEAADQEPPARPAPRGGPGPQQPQGPQ